LKLSSKVNLAQTNLSYQQKTEEKTMNISDLNHLEVVDNCAIVGGGDVANAGNIILNISKQLQQTSYNDLKVTAVNIQQSPLTQTSSNNGSLNTDVAVRFS